jgi:hypothetical protein
MKANELMIGDWYSWEAEGKKYYYQVTKETFSSPDYDIYNFQPVPLTPEILEKNGFIEITKRIKKLIWLWKENGVLVEILEATPNVYQLTIHHDSSDLSDQRIYVRHLHELQHALKLCGIEKTIEL